MVARYRSTNDQPRLVGSHPIVASHKKTRKWNAAMTSRWKKLSIVVMDLDFVLLFALFVWTRTNCLVVLCTLCYFFCFAFRMLRHCGPRTVGYEIAENTACTSKTTKHQLNLTHENKKN